MLISIVIEIMIENKTNRFITENLYETDKKNNLFLSYNMFKAAIPANIIYNF